MTERLAELQSTHLGFKLYVAIWALAPGVAATDLSTILPTHLEFLHELEARGVLFASGPLFDTDEPAPPQGGLSFFRCATIDEARALIDTEPFVKSGLRTYTLRRWIFNEGTVALRINAGIGTFQVS